MASEADIELAARSHRPDPYSREAQIGSDEKRHSLHKLMLAKHENAIDSSEDEDDEGGIPAWVAMRRALYEKKMLPKGKGAAGPSSACVTADPSRRASVNVFTDHTSIDNKQDTAVRFDVSYESSRDLGGPTPTESELEPPLWQENDNPTYPADNSTYEISKLEQPGSYDYVEYFSGSCKVMKGGFAYARETVNTKVLSEPFRAFPPLSNSGYMLTSTGHDPKFVYRAELANSTFIPPSCVKALLRNHNYKSTPSTAIVSLSTKKTKDEDQWIDSDGELSEAGNVGDAMQVYPPDTVFMLCKKCGKHHIPPGLFHSLAQRDKCGSDLPGWFPAEDIENPWRAFTDLNNEIIRLENLEKGFTTLPKVWDKVYHEEHPVWKALGHRGGGWWRCRTGPNAPRAEQKCVECHVKYPKEDLPNGQTMESAMRILGQYRNFIRGHTDRVGQQDKAVALEMIRETMQSQGPLLPSRLHPLGTGWSGYGNKIDEPKEEQPQKTNERMVLEAMWNHQGQLSTLEIPPEFRGFDLPDPDLEDEDEDGEEENGLMMKTTIRRRPPPLSFHRQTSSLGSTFFSSTISPLSPLSPLSPGVPEEERQEVFLEE